MTNADKRARQKERRAAVVAARSAAQRRRVIVQLAVAIVAIGAVLGLALYAGTSGEGCFAEEPTGKTYSSEPEMSLEDGVDYKATIETSKGPIEIDLLEEDTPTTVNNFVCLARDEFYDGLKFHRVEKDVVIQGGDPQGTGAGGPGYAIKDELPEGEENPYVFGTLGMANSGPNTGGSQFFIVVHDPEPEGGFKPFDFPPDYPVFGKVDPDDDESVDTLLEIANAEVEGGNSPNAAQPVEPILMESVEITED